MFRRLVFENSAALFTLTAFFTALSIYATFAWRALRMKPPQTQRFENLPFATPTPSAVGAQPCCTRVPADGTSGRSQTAPLQS